MNHTRAALALIVIVYLCVGALYAIKTPDWQVPDEPAHYNYIRALAQEGRFPVLETGDYDQDYLGRLTSQGFPPQLSVDPIEYEDHQPPLYYLLATPVYLAFDGALLPLRLFSVLIGAGVVLLAYAVAATVFARRPLIQLGTAAFAAFLPQHVAMMAGVNNDSLAELLIGLALWMTVRWIKALEGQRTRGQLAGLGVILGLGLVTKTTVVSVALAVFVALLLAWRHDADRSWLGLVRLLALVFGPALLIVIPWWMRNISVYGGLDIYGLANHDAVVVGQPRTTDWIRDQGLDRWLERGLTFTFQSFWGQFGWMGVLMPTWLYRALAVWSGMLVLGFFYWLQEVRNEQSERDEGLYPQRNAQLIFLAATVGFVILAYLYYNRTFVQHQGRYLFPALIPIALTGALATDGLLRFLRVPNRLRPVAFAAPYLAMVALDLYALWRFIIPALT
jgi:4-amino-4-deoxy-L-arabinose transferase-like glycosyltransferase